MYGKAHHENQLHHEAAVAEEAEAGTGADRAAVAATVVAVRTAGLAGTKANLYLWISGFWLMDNGIPMGCRCLVFPQRGSARNDFPRQFLFASAHDKVSRA
jgi:hypothetical protein